MKYWDSSALVSLFVEERGTALAREWLRHDSEVVTWVLTIVEMVSAVERRTREGTLNDAREAVLGLFDRSFQQWHSVEDVRSVCDRARQLLAAHDLKTADALQLASALRVRDALGVSLDFVSLDRKLARSAAAEGLTVLTWPDAAPV